MSERWIREWLNSFFEDELPSLFSPSWSAADRYLEPLAEVEDREDSVEVWVDLPYVERKEAIQLHATESSLEVNATMKRSVKWERWGLFQRNLEFVCFKKKIRLPDRVQPESAKAQFKNGILKVTFPKIKRKVNITFE